ncbi:hypothetical protein HHI36_015604, partial [Cryptolaemus montrouzieri]
MTSRIIAKIACWSHTSMERSDLHFYLTWLKDQLKMQYDQLATLVTRADALRGAMGEQPMGTFKEASFSIDEPQKHDEIT